MKVLLIQPPPGANSFVAKSGIPEPLALEILAATIPRHDAEIFDMRLDRQPLREKIEIFQPDVIGVGCLTAGYYECVNLLETIKDIDPNIISVVGGHHPTVMPQDFVGASTDFMVIGDEKKHFLSWWILKIKAQRGRRRGLAIPRNGRVQFTNKRPLIHLDEMPIPRRELTRQYRQKYFRGATKSYACLLTSRGCQFRCKFCCQWTLNKGSYRIRKTENVVDELLRIRENFIDFVDDNSWGNTNWMSELCEKIKAAGIQKNYKLYARSDLIIKRPDLSLSGGILGLKAVLIGFESFKDEDLNNWNKRNTVSKNVRATRNIERLWC